MVQASGHGTEVGSRDQRKRQAKGKKKISDSQKSTVRRFDGTYNKYLVINNITYQIKPLTNKLQLLTSALKPLFGIVEREKFLVTYQGKKYIGTKALKNKKGEAIEEFPFDLMPESLMTAGFREKLRTIYFFRYLIGFRTTKISIRVSHDGEKYTPVSYSETKLAKDINLRTGTGFKITPTREKEKSPKYIRVDPEDEMRRILKLKHGKITLNHIYDFLADVKREIIETDPSFLWLVNSIQRKLMDLLEL